MVHLLRHAGAQRLRMHETCTHSRDVSIFPWNLYMNPYILLALVIGWGASVAGAGWYGLELGDDRATARQARDDQVRQETREAAQQGAADAIAKLKPINTTIRAKTETIVRESPVYRDCLNTPDGLRSINSALTGRIAEPAGGEQLPKADGSK